MQIKEYLKKVKSKEIIKNKTFIYKFIFNTDYDKNNTD